MTYIHQCYISGLAIGLTYNFDDLVPDCSISTALAMEILQSCTKPSIFGIEGDHIRRPTNPHYTDVTRAERRFKACHSIVCSKSHLTKKTPNLCITGLLWGNPPVTPHKGAVMQKMCPCNDVALLGTGITCYRLVRVRNICVIGS